MNKFLCKMFDRRQRVKKRDSFVTFQINCFIDSNFNHTFFGKSAAINSNSNFLLRSQECIALYMHYIHS